VAFSIFFVAALTRSIVPSVASQVDGHGEQILVFVGSRHRANASASSRTQHFTSLNSAIDFLNKKVDARTGYVGPIEILIDPETFYAQSVDLKFTSKNLNPDLESESYPTRITTNFSVLKLGKRAVFDGRHDPSKIFGKKNSFLKIVDSVGIKTNVSIQNIVVKNYLGGIGIVGPRDATKPENGNNQITGVSFAQIGSKYYGMGDGCSIGFAALGLSNTSDNIVNGNYFSNNENAYYPNRCPPPDRDSRRGIHSIYVAWRSHRNRIINNSFSNYSGAAVKLSESNDNKVLGNYFYNPNDLRVPDVLNSVHYSSTLKECPSRGTVVLNNFFKHRNDLSHVTEFNITKGDPSCVQSTPKERLRVANNLLSQGAYPVRSFIPLTGQFRSGLCRLPTDCILNNSSASVHKNICVRDGESPLSPVSLKGTICQKGNLFNPPRSSRNFEIPTQDARSTSKS